MGCLSFVGIIKMDSKIKYEGAHAYNEGLSPEDCPYKDKWNRHAWLSGWYERFKQEELAYDL